MLRELYDGFVEVAQKAAKPKKPIITPLESGDPNQKRFLMADGTTVETISVRKPLRRHVVNDIASLALWGTETGADGGHVWHDDSGVTLVLDDAGYRENVITLPLPKHPKFTALAGASKFTQRTLIDFLRLNLKAEVAAAHADFIAKLRNVKIKQDETGEANLQHGREQMGKTIMQEVTGAAELPEDLTLKVPIWLHLDCTVEVECAFDILIAEGEFLFRPKPGVIAQCQCLAQAWLHEQLEAALGANAVIYFGKP